jgi:phenylacetic acid degradation operon negative regulatory protein
LQIEPGLARTSLSRLVATKTLIRIKSGRNTFYQLGNDSRTDFKTAAQRIYGTTLREPTGQFQIAIIDPCDDRAKTREKLVAQEYKFIGATVAIKPIYKDCGVNLLPNPMISSIIEPSQSLSMAAQDAWKIAKLNEGYKHFLQLFPPVVKPSDFSSADAIVTRVLLVHQFRRLSLRDPNLPDHALPKDWKGFEARSRFLANIDGLSVACEKWIIETGFLSGKTLDDPR